MSEPIKTLYLDSCTPRLAFDFREGIEPVLLCIHGNSSHRAVWGPLLDHFHDHAALRLDLQYFRQRTARVAGFFPSVREVFNGMRRVDQTLSEEVFLPFIEAGMHKSPDGFRFALDPETYGSWQPADLWEAVEKNNCPMLIIRAEHSSVMSRSAAELMVQKAQFARLKEIGGAGHFLILGKPEEVANEIRGFLEETGI